MFLAVLLVVRRKHVKYLNILYNIYIYYNYNIHILSQFRRYSVQKYTELHLIERFTP